MIEIRDLWAGYGGNAVLRGVDFSVQAGDFVGVLGPNACGKSTLIRVISGVLRPQSGRLRTCGLEAGFVPARRLAREVAVVPQSTEIPFPFSGFEVVLMGRYPRLGRFAREGPQDLEAVSRALEDTDTAVLADRLVTQVSGGERQRLILARALAQEAPLLLLDEATASLDVHRKIDAFDLLTRLNRAGTTIVAVMHDLNLAACYCDRLLLLRDGIPLAEGKVEQVLTYRLVKECYGVDVYVGVNEITGCRFLIPMAPS